MGRLLSFGVALCALLSCDTDAVDSFLSSSLDPWIYTNTVTGELQVNESLMDEPLDLDITIAHNDSYPFENLYIKYSVMAEGDTVTQDVRSIQLQNNLGAWKGNSNRGKYYYSENLEEKLTLNSTTINVSIAQYSRMDLLPGVDQISISLNKSQP